MAAEWYRQMVKEHGPTYLVDRIYHLSFARNDPDSQIRDEIDDGIRRLKEMTPEEALRDADQIRNELRITGDYIFASASDRNLKLLEEKIEQFVDSEIS